MKAPAVTRLVDGYFYRWQGPDWVEIEVTDIRRKSDEWKGEMKVLAGSPEMAGRHRAETTHTLSVIQSRSSLAKSLGDRYALSNGDQWADYLEMACVMTVRSERIGEPFSRVGRLPEENRPAFWLIDKYIRLHHATSIWADGSTGKSTLAALWALAVATGQEVAGFVPHFQGPVIWLDWESDEWDLDDTLKCLKAGHGLEAEFDYRREVWPLTQTFKQVANEVAKNNVALVVVDSVGYAMGGDSEKGSDALAFAAAVRALNTSVLLVDHVRKGDTGGKAFGSVYKFNEVRNGFELTRHQEEGAPESIVGVRCRKANKGGFAPTIFLKVEFGEQSIHYEQTTEIPEETVAEVLSVSDRIRRVLRAATGLMNADAITDEMNEHTDRKVPVGQVKARLSELVRKGTVYVNAAKGHSRGYSLVTAREGDE